MPRGEPIYSREKDRACYLHQLVEVDLTVVTARVSGVEFKSPDSLRRRTGRHFAPAWNLNPPEATRRSFAKHVHIHSGRLDFVADSDSAASRDSKAHRIVRDRDRGRGCPHAGIGGGEGGAWRG